MNKRIIALALLCFAPFVQAKTNNYAVNGLFNLDSSENPLTSDTSDFSTVYGWSGDNNAVTCDTYGQPHPETEMMAFIGDYAGEGIWQGTPTIIEEGKTYTIKADFKTLTMWRCTVYIVGIENGAWNYFYSKNITFSDTAIGETTEEWVTYGVSFNSDDYPDLVGKNLGIELVNTDWDGGQLYATNIRVEIEEHWSNTPTPTDLAVDQATALTLNWTVGVDPEYMDSVNPDIIQYNLYGPYAGTNVTDPNISDLDPVVLYPADIVDGKLSYEVTDLSYDTKYYWRVDEMQSVSADDPNNLKGAVWTFTTKPSIPVVTGQPEYAVVSDGDTAEFSVDVDSISDITYLWYKSNNKTADPTSDSQISTAAVLSIPEASTTDEAYYYCVVGNDSNTKVTTSVVGLAIKRRLGYWPLGSTDGYTDMDGSFNATPASAADVTYTDGPYDTGSESAVVVDDNSYAAVPGALNPSEFSNEMTVGAWIKLTGTLTSEDGYGIVTKIGDTNSTDTWKWALYARDNGGGTNTVRFLTWNSGDLWAGSGSVVTDQWVHIAVTVRHNDSGSLVGDFYVNGSYWFSDTSFNYGNADSADIYIGKFGPAGYTFPGDIDDVIIFNYGMSAEEIIDNLYFPVSQTGVCLEAVDARFDTTGPDGTADCKVDIYDFAKFADAWMDCGKYPVSACND